MKKLNLKLKNNRKGITLIALVITIIVLLILAGVTIATLTGDNGILTRASEASEETKQSNAEEQVKLAVLGSIGTDGNIDNNELKTNLEKIENITGVPETITDAHYPLTVNIDGYNITINKDGNTTDPITIEQAKNENMLDKSENSIMRVEDGIVTIPGGFKVSEDSAENVEGGIVIEDGNKNQFVWIPVTESGYVRNRTYVGFQEEAFTDKDYLPDEIQPDLNGETMLERIGLINEEAEKEAVLNVGGFYIARFETGIENNTLVSKKDVSVWNNITQEEAKARAKNMINTAHAKTALCSGIQWDVVMEFVDGQLDGSTPARQFFVRTASDARHLSEIGYSGANVADKVCNIYDLEGNCIEWVAENALGKGLVRGGTIGNLNYEASSRGRILGETIAEVSCRIVLYVI